MAAAVASSSSMTTLCPSPSSMSLPSSNGGTDDGSSAPLSGIGAVRAGQNALATELRGFSGDEVKHARFKEFVVGFLSASVFHASDVWLPMERGPGVGVGGDSSPTRLFLHSADSQVGRPSAVWGRGGQGSRSGRDRVVYPLAVERSYPASLPRPALLDTPFACVSGRRRTGDCGCRRPHQAQRGCKGRCCGCW